MKITFLITDLNSGGAEWQLARLAADLVAGGEDVRVLALFGDGEAAAWLRARGVPVALAGFDRPWKLWRLCRLWRLLREARPQVLHTWMFHANLAGKLVGRLAGCRRIIAGLRVAEKERPWHLGLEKLTLFLNAAVTVNSPGLRRFALARGLPEAKLVMIPNSVDPEMFSFIPPVPPTPDEPWKLLYFGRVSRQKGLPWLIEALAGLRAAGGPEPRLDLVGAVEDPRTEARLRQQIAAFGLEAAARFLPPVPRAGVPALLHSYHLLVLPSLWEGMPNVVLEAAAAGLPVVATAVEGTADLVADGSTGRLAPPADASGLGRVISAALADYAQTLKMAHAARDRIETGHRPETIARHYLELYRQA